MMRPSTSVSVLAVSINRDNLSNGLDVFDEDMLRPW
jgi:hypothetical protein